MDSSLLTYDNIKNIVQKKGYLFFMGPLNVNMIGIRGSNRQVDNYDDHFVLLWQENAQNNIWVNDKFTTDPGIYYMQKKFLSPKGCGILAEGQYRHMWEVGLHNGKYEAFVQTGNTCKVYRDRNKDNYMDFDPTTLEEGWFGCNQHHGYDTNRVNNNSAMCQVHAEIHDLEASLHIAKASIAKWGNKFTYTLLNESDFMKEPVPSKLTVSQPTNG